MTTTTTKEPSQEFMTALRELKPIWIHNEKIDDIKVMEKKFNNLIAIGKKEGLSINEVTRKLYERPVICEGCAQEFTAYKDHNPLCPSCEDKRERQEWTEEQKEAMEGEDIIERYSNKILGIVPEYEMSYDEMVKIREDNFNYRKQILEQEIFDSSKRMADMTKAEKEEERKKRRLVKEESKISKSDYNLKHHGTPKYVFSKRISKVRCDCEIDNMRQGIFCKPCMLLKKAHDYTLSLFKDAAEGRSTVI